MTIKQLIERVNRKRRASRLGLEVITIKGALVGRDTTGQFISLKG
jgi:hypothetical protein